MKINEKGFERNSINWYPGHMAKAKRAIQQVLPLIDAVIELADSRLPVTSRNPDFETLFKNKPRILVFNKYALCDPQRTRAVAKAEEDSGKPVLYIDCKQDPDMKSVTAALKEVCAEKLARSAQKGINKPIRALVAGITNVGKSTFINAFTGSKKAKTEDRPGVTRANAWISSPYGVELLDTPGLLWPKLGDKTAGVKLAAVGSVRDDILDLTELACDTLGVLRERGYSGLLRERYKIEPCEEDTNYDLLLKIGRARGFLVSGGEINEERTSSVLLDEFRGGKIGRMTLD
ncbi:MAG: ribosome biogenesis GTPase YlqF [Clostridia bacterium]|nr:ribosome biogenesis GTPase YlqF [Clostridia bacterium]